MRQIHRAHLERVGCDGGAFGAGSMLWSTVRVHTMTVASRPPGAAPLAIAGPWPMSTQRRQIRATIVFGILFLIGALIALPFAIADPLEQLPRGTPLWLAVVLLAVSGLGMFVTAHRRSRRERG
jgi:peptidoglycan/LPS O-acetylase OafA/YrhL